MNSDRAFVERVILFLLLLASICIVFLYFLFFYVSNEKDVVGISESKLKTVVVKCISFAGDVKEIPITTVDVIADDVKAIFDSLVRMRFPIYVASCHNARQIRNSSRISLHAYGCAIDLNYLLNPYFNAVNFNMIPARLNNPEDDRNSIIQSLDDVVSNNAEMEAVLKVVIQNSDSDDRFLNRSVIRPGMVTDEIVALFKRYGFNIWGGEWRAPIDYMHFQTPRSVAEALADAQNIEQRREIWEAHKKSIRQELLLRP